MSLPKDGDREQHARDLHQSALSKKLIAANIDTNTFQLYLQAFKAERRLEVWIKNKTDQQWQNFINYPFCQYSGDLGPKRKEGDLQIPEGLYHIDRFNPKSNFYLSLGINYPNASDKKRSDHQHPGSDIFIHGGCATVGCIPITDDKIAELFILTVDAAKNGQTQIPVHIFPSKMNKGKLKQICKSYPQHCAFWEELSVAYDFFESKKEVPGFRIDPTGKYIVQ